MEISNSMIWGRGTKRLGLVLLLLTAILLCSGGPVLATGADVTVTQVRNYSGTALGSAFIETYLGNIKPLVSVPPYVNALAVLKDSKVWNFANGSYGFGINEGDNQIVYVRAWAEGSIALNNHYGYAIGTTSGPGDNAKQLSFTIDAKYKAAAPFAPVVKSITYGKTVNHEVVPPTESSVLSATPGQKLPGTGEDAEIDTCIWEYWNDMDPIHQTASISYLSDYGILKISNPEESTYHFMVKLKNVFGETAFSGEYTYTLEAAGPVEVPYDFVAGINTFSFPFDFSKGVELTVGGTVLPDIQIETVQDLIMRLNEVSATQINVLGWYANTGQEYKGLKKIAYSGTAIDQNSSVPSDPNQTVDTVLKTGIDPAQPYQLTVPVGFNLVIKGVLKAGE